ncbi:hypothetical protein AMS68_002171 [Peltaster fructicola]|uniref:DUF1749-domain-containing protein n=1 Tax=Peltaster fructicola TaxID=286661 RepID=A0A6H0XPJ7_9PEZI|nr:hypothetical protein AMS68_002171 [Peltaster fructicola]
MDPVMLPAASVPGILHFVPPNLSAFEPTKPLIENTSTNTVLWVGGLCDTLLSVSYPLAIAKALGPSWSLITASLSSSGLQFGIGSISQDVKDINKILAYIHSRRPSGKIVLMGHSTGCQDCLQYAIDTSQGHGIKIAGLILQAPVSDREALHMILPEAHMVEANRTALDLCEKSHGNDILAVRLTEPIFGKAPISAKRWVDLASPGPDHTGADDMFSSDLSDERLLKTFGMIPAEAPLLMLYSGKDEAVPEHVNKKKLIQRWVDVRKQRGGTVDTVNGGIVPDATHNLNGCPEHVVTDIISRVLGFISSIESR